MKKIQIVQNIANSSTGLGLTILGGMCFPQHPIVGIGILAVVGAMMIVGVIANKKHITVIKKMAQNK
jgi:hypothetical protein